MSVKEVLLMNAELRRAPRILLILAVILLMTVMTAVPAFAAATDEIENFTITVDVNEDASLQMTYHIDWTRTGMDRSGST